MKTQIEPGKKVKELANVLTGKDNELFYNLSKLIFQKIKRIPVDENEKNIRWKRTAEQILQDGYVYQGKACTDLCVVAISILKVKDIKAEIVRVASKKRNALHNMIKINNKYYDVTTSVFYNKKSLEMNDWKILAAGRDAWDIGLKDIEDGKKDLKYLK